jgi:RNA polymerase sigma factor (sigma-70 family)
MPIMTSQREDIKLEIEKTLQLLEAEGRSQTAANIRLILHANLDRGRVENYIENDIKRVSEYAQRVVDQYAKLNPYIRSIQSDRSDDVWLPLFKQLQYWAYNFLLRKNFVPGLSTSIIAEECATASAMNMLDAYFPYDIDFEPWAHVIVINTCLHFFRDETKKSVIPPQNIVELDEKLSSLEDINPGNRDDNGDLLQALSRLSDARRQVIQLHYLDDLPLPEVAEVMGKSIGAIHSLHFNALQDLRKILGDNRNNT